MKLALIVLTLFAPMFAQAAGTPQLQCKVITNGSGVDWETAFTFSAPIVGRSTQLTKTAVTAYGNTFSVEGNVMATEIPEMTDKSYGLTLHVYLNNDQIVLTDIQLGMDRVLETTGNISDAHANFTLKSGGRNVSYGVNCAIKP